MEHQQVLPQDTVQQDMGCHEECGMDPSQPGQMQLLKSPALHLSWQCLLVLHFHAFPALCQEWVSNATILGQSE